MNETKAPSAGVRHFVRDLLENQSSYQQLDTEDRTKLARNLVEVLSYASGAPSGGIRPPSAAGLAEQEEDPFGQAGRAGAETFRQYVESVDFPEFVANLVKGVYDSIVQSSIQQMKAYGELLESVAKSVEQYAQDEIDPDVARDFIQKSFPGSIKIEDTRDGRRLALNDEFDENPPDFTQALDVDENMELNDDNEGNIVYAAQLKMARQRQQFLSTMVLMGINRIIVTDGEIKASVLFSSKSSDTFEGVEASGSRTRATSYQRNRNIWGTNRDVSTSVSTSYDSSRAENTSELEMKARLSGSVKINFRSETFPLERIATPGQLGAVQNKGG